MVPTSGRRRAAQPSTSASSTASSSRPASPTGHPPSTIADDTPIVLHHPVGSRTEMQEVQQQPHQRRALIDSQDSEDLILEVHRLQFVLLVKWTVTSWKEFEAIIQVIGDFKRRLSCGNEDMGDLVADTIWRVEELLQNYPQLIARFREFVGVDEACPFREILARDAARRGAPTDLFPVDRPLP